ncbi:MAG: sulfotransferase [Wenzhouxiangellaceae bacterium]|nr:sulfotransferase [Wenzhouxiangellaceae bacterium]
MTQQHPEGATRPAGPTSNRTPNPGSNDEPLKQAEALLKQQRFGPASQLLESIRADDPDNRRGLYMLAVCRRMTGRFNDALALLDRLQAVAPDYGRAWQEIGHNHRDAGRPREAIAAYEKAIELNPGLAASWRFLAAAHRQAGSAERAAIAEANYKRLQALPPELVSVTSMMHEGQLYKAERLCRHFLQQHPRHLEAMRLLAAIGTRLHIYDDAEFLLESALEIDPDFDLARLDYVKVLHKRQKFEQAWAQADELRRRMPGNLAAELAYANQCSAVGMYERALEVLDALVDRVANPSNVQMLRGHALKTIGEHERAVEAYRSAYRLRPELGDAWWSLANMKTFRFSGDEMRRMHELAGNGRLARTDEYHLCFALGKAHEDRGEYEQAFAFYRRGNRLKNDELRYSADRMQADFDRQKAFFTPGRVAQFEGRGIADDDPIFIVGLPRAGSTLIEQILASHSRVDGTLELPNILAMVHRLNGRLERGREPRYPAVLADLPPERFAELGRQYLDETRIHRQGAPYFTDKMPNNFRHIGLILSILPSARIVDARREAMACCFSGFKQLFAEGQEFTYSLDDIGRYYRGYVDLMAHWKRLYPDRILQVDYEDVVDDLEGQVRRLLDYLELPFEDACVEFHRTQRSVRTASSEQVRKPIYTGGVEQWRHFQPWLGELETALAGQTGGSMEAEN